jgi:predicted ArsR family transcriptional regulator
MISTDTSAVAYEKIVPHKTILQQLCLEAFEEVESWGATADEIANRLGLDLFSIRPRITELYQDGKIELTGMRRKNEKGNSQRVYKLTNENNKTIGEG